MPAIPCLDHQAGPDCIHDHEHIRLNVQIHIVMTAHVKYHATLTKDNVTASAKRTVHNTHTHTHSALETHPPRFSCCQPRTPSAGGTTTTTTNTNTTGQSYTVLQSQKNNNSTLIYSRLLLQPMQAIHAYNHSPLPQPLRRLTQSLFLPAPTLTPPLLQTATPFGCNTNLSIACATPSSSLLTIT